MGSGFSSQQPSAASLRPLKVQLPTLKQQPPQSQRRVIFPALHGATTNTKQKEETQKTAKEQKQSDLSPRHRRSSLFDHEPGLKSPIAGTSRMQSDLDHMPSNDELLDAMDDTYDITKSKPQRSRQRSNTLGDMPAPAVAAAAKRAPASTSTAAAIFSPRCAPAPDTNTAFVIPPFGRGRGPAPLSGEAASGELVRQLSTTNKSKGSPPRKLSLFDSGSTLPKVQHTPKAQPDPLTPRSPPSRDAISKPLPSILRKTSSLISSPMTPAKPTRRPSVHFGEGQPSDKNLHIPELTRASSVRGTSFDRVTRKSSSRDESSVGSASSARSNTSGSLRRVSSENSMSSTQETERKRATAETLAAVADGAAAAEGDSNGKRLRKKIMTRHASLETGELKEISFDPRVWVVEYEQDEVNNWFTHEELERFKCEAIDRIRRRHAQQQLLPSGTGRIVVPRQRPGAGRALFSDPALGVGTEEVADDEVTAAASKSQQTQTVPSRFPAVSPSDERRIQRTLLSEIRNILVVDPHDMFLKLFAKALRAMMSHVICTTATSAEEALRRIAAAKVVFPQSEGGATHGFDIIIVEERLQLFHRHRRGNASSGKNGPRPQQAAGDDQNQHDVPASGSALISQIVAEQKSIVSTMKNRPRYSLLIGVSAHLQLDGERLRRSGADFVWGKPPPSFDDKLRIEILRSVLQKRGKDGTHYLT